MQETKTTRAFMKIAHTNEIIDLGEFQDISSKDIKKFLDKSIKIIITEDSKVIKKYDDIIYKIADSYAEELINRKNNKPETRIAGFGV